MPLWRTLLLLYTLIPVVLAVMWLVYGSPAARPVSWGGAVLVAASAASLGWAFIGGGTALEPGDSAQTVRRGGATMAGLGAGGAGLVLSAVGRSAASEENVIFVAGVLTIACSVYLTALNLRWRVMKSRR